MGTAVLNWRKLRTQTWHHAPDLAPWAKPLLQELRSRVPKISGMNWILSSGTQSVRTLKAIGLSEEAILTSAESVNKHLQSTFTDRWLVAIPRYHIGGLAVYARAQLSGAKVSVLEGKWSAKAFVAAVEHEGATLASLVPAQVHDLVSGGLKSPACLRAVVVGGGALEPWLYIQARTQGWPLLPSYGLTECASQVATASLNSLAHAGFPALQTLGHVELKLCEQRIFLQSAALCRWVATANEQGYSLESPLRSGWLPTEDLAEQDNGGLRILGRRDSVVKILGILVPMQEVEFEAGEFFRGVGWDEPFAVMPAPDSRQGSKLLVVTDSSASLRDWEGRIAEYNAAVSGVRRLGGPCWVPKIERGEMGKVKRAELAALISARTSN